MFCNITITAAAFTVKIEYEFNGDKYKTLSPEK